MDFKRILINFIYLGIICLGLEFHRFARNIDGPFISLGAIFIMWFLLISGFKGLLKNE